MPSSGSEADRQRWTLRCRGSSTVAVLGGSLVLLFVALLFAQFLVWCYTRAVLDGAAREAVRAGARHDAAPTDCLARFEAVRSSLLGGELDRQVGAPECRVTNEDVTLRVEVHLRRWLPVTPDWRFTVEAVAVTEELR